jgi:hypothetical protein
MSPLQSISPQTLAQAHPYYTRSKAKNKRPLDESNDQEVNTKISKIMKTREKASNLPSPKVSQVIKNRAKKQKNERKIVKEDKCSQSLFDPLFLPNTLLSICGEYSTLSGCINLFLSGVPISLDTLKKSIVTANNIEIIFFVDNLDKLRKRHRSVSKENFNRIVHVFFQYADLNNQDYFFSLLLNEDVHFLSNILSALPRDLTKLNLNKCKCSGDIHVEKILEFKLEHLELQLTRLFTDEGIQRLVSSKNMECLQTLHFTINKVISKAAFQALVNNPYMIALQNLKLSGGNLSLRNEAIEILAKSSHLHNLKNLDLSGNHLLSDEGILVLIQSPLMDRLHSVDLSHCNNISLGMGLRVIKILEENASKRQL